MPLATGNLSLLQQYHLSTLQKLHVVLDIAKGIHTVHSAGYIHGDIKEKNILINVAPSGTITAGIIDLGMAVSVSEACKTFPITNKKYGSLRYTSIELASCKKPFNKDPQKIELWALGCLFHLVLLNQDPPWIPLFIKEVTDVNDQLSPTSLKQFHKMVRQIEQQRTNMLETIKPKNLSSEWLIYLLIYDLLRIRPQDRINSAQVVSRVTELINLF
jgi:serine/threonine protein kinase